MASRVAAPLLLLAGCAGGAYRPGAASECPATTLCGSTPPPGLTLAAELIPPAESDFARTEFIAVKFDASWTARLAVPERTKVQGQVVDEKMQPVAALVAVARASLLPGLPGVTRSTTTGPNGFSIELGEGSYQVHVLPQGAAQALYPPETVSVDVRGAGQNARTPLVVVPLGRRDLLSGVVHPAAGPNLAGVKVRVIDAATEELMSSVVTTDGLGSFTLALSSEVRQRDKLLLVADGGPLLVTLQRALDSKAALSQAPVELRAPAVPALVSYVIPLFGRSLSGADVPVVGARVVVRGDLSEPGSGTTALLQSSVVTDAEGRASLSLVPGSEANRPYTVTIHPPSDSMFAAGAFEVAAGPVGGQLARTLLDVRPALVGQLLGPTGEPVRGAIIAAQVASSVSEPVASDVQLPQVVTDSKDGRFLIRLQVGRYDLQITPPFGSGLPSWSANDLSVSGETDLGALRLPVAAAARVEVVSAAGTSIPGVQVRLFADVDRECMASSGCRAPRLRADSTTASDGVAHVLLGVP